jgi:hypothetical protein
MEQCRSLEANNFSYTPEIPRILRNTQVHYRLHNSKPLVPDMSQINPVRALLDFLGIHFNIIPIYICLPSGISPLGFPTCVLFSPIRATCSAHITLN